MNVAIKETQNTESKMRYWEDLVDLPPRHYGPLIFSNQLLDQLLDLFGEKHPVHTSDSFARSIYGHGRIIPGAFIHSFTSGWLVQHADPIAVIALRSVSWDYIRPLHPDSPFYFTSQTESSEPIDDRRGMLVTQRRVHYEDGRACAVGRMNALVLRRPSQELHRI